MPAKLPLVRTGTPTPGADAPLLATVTMSSPTLSAIAAPLLSPYDPVNQVIAAAACEARRRLGPTAPLSKLALIWAALILAQVALGMATIWSNKAADIATLIATGGLRTDPPSAGYAQAERDFVQVGIDFYRQHPNMAAMVLECTGFQPFARALQRLALRRVNLSPQDAVYVGDNYYADVVGARRAGLTPILYDPRGIFPDPDCTTIKSFDELSSVIKVI